MRRHHSLIATVVAALAVTSCATTMTVSSHVERGLDFSPYRTFAWGPADALPTGDPRLDQDPFFKDHLQGAVEKQLAQRGLALSPEGAPDLLVHYHASVTQEIDVVDRDSLSTYCDSDECRRGGRRGSRVVGSGAGDAGDERPEREGEHERCAGAPHDTSG